MKGISFFKKLSVHIILLINMQNYVYSSALKTVKIQEGDDTIGICVKVTFVQSLDVMKFLFNHL